MENINTALPPAVRPPTVPDAAPKVDTLRAKEQFARDFESVFIEKLLEEMKNTTGDWGFEQDGTSEQIHGLFWMQLARDLSNQGGFGMWKDIYQSLTSVTENPDNVKRLDNTL